MPVIGSQWFSPWIWRMAWRDSRTSRKKLLLFSCSIILGVAALAAIGSLGTNLQRAIEQESKDLLGADLVITSPEPFSTEQEEFLKQLGGEQSREISLSTMVYFPRNDGTRLVQARALGGDFPFYGRLETDPAGASETFRRSGGGALAEETLLRQFDANAGDPIRLGGLTTTIAGRLKKIPGETISLPSIAPRVYLSMDDLSATGLLRPGSLARFRIYFKFSPATDMPRLLERIKPQLDKFRLGHDTVEERKRELGKALLQQGAARILEKTVGFD